MVETNRKPDLAKEPSPKEFGIVFAVFFTLVSLFPLIKGGSIRPWALMLALVFLTAAFFSPSLLRPLAKIWMKVGLVMHKIMSPLILGIIYFGVFTPMGLIARACGADFLRLRAEKKTDSYWIIRNPAGPAPDSLKNQF